jgi:L-threonylcarbamoyladenylate synthase
MENASEVIDHQIFIYPTDTVWGIGAAYDCEKAIKRINEIKRIDREKPQSLMFPSIPDLLQFIEKNDAAILQQLDFLNELFKFQVTLAIPLSSFNLELAPSVACQSEYICVRVFNKPWIKEIFRMAGGAFTTTSLNITGFPPVTDFEKAKTFHEQYCPKAQLVAGDMDCLGGTASSIIKIENRKVTFWRKGEHVQELLSLFEKFSLNCN